MWSVSAMILEFNRSLSHLLDHQSVERCDAAIVAHGPARVGRAAADCDLKRYACVRGGERWALGYSGASARVLISAVFLIRDNITERPPDRASTSMASLYDHLSNLYIVQNTLSARAEFCV